MRFLVLIPYHDMADSMPQVWRGFIRASSYERALRMVEELQSNARQLLWLLAGPEACQPEELERLEGDDLLESYGLAVGDIQVLAGEDLRSLGTRDVGPPRRRTIM